ncbi:MAG: hypothetical protein ACI311_03510 [Bacilli bacterium]
MKKLLKFLISVFVVFSITSCGEKNSEGTNDNHYFPDDNVENDGNNEVEAPPDNLLLDYVYDLANNVDDVPYFDDSFTSSTSSKKNLNGRKEKINVDTSIVSNANLSINIMREFKNTIVRTVKVLDQWVCLNSGTDYEFYYRISYLQNVNFVILEQYSNINNQINYLSIYSGYCYDGTECINFKSTTYNTETMEESYRYSCYIEGDVLTDVSKTKLGNKTIRYTACEVDLKNEDPYTVVYDLYSINNGSYYSFDLVKTFYRAKNESRPMTYIQESYIYNPSNIESIDYIDYSLFSKKASKFITSSYLFDASFNPVVFYQIQSSVITLRIDPNSLTGYLSMEDKGTDGLDVTFTNGYHLVSSNNSTLIETVDYDYSLSSLYSNIDYTNSIVLHITSKNNNFYENILSILNELGVTFKDDYTTDSLQSKLDLTEIQNYSAFGFDSLSASYLDSTISTFDALLNMNLTIDDLLAMNISEFVKAEEQQQNTSIIYKANYEIKGDIIFNPSRASINLKNINCSFILDALMDIRANYSLDVYAVYEDNNFQKITSINGTKESAKVTFQGNDEEIDMSFINNSFKIALILTSNYEGNETLLSSFNYPKVVSDDFFSSININDQNTLVHFKNLSNNDYFLAIGDGIKIRNTIQFIVSEENAFINLGSFDLESYNSYSLYGNEKVNLKFFLSSSGNKILLQERNYSIDNRSYEDYLDNLYLSDLNDLDNGEYSIIIELSIDEYLISYSEFEINGFNDTYNFEYGSVSSNTNNYTITITNS